MATPLSVHLRNSPQYGKLYRQLRDLFGEEVAARLVLAIFRRERL